MNEKFIKDVLRGRREELDKLLKTVDSINTVMVDSALKEMNVIEMRLFPKERKHGMCEYCGDTLKSNQKQEECFFKLKKRSKSR